MHADPRESDSHASDSRRGAAAVRPAAVSEPSAAEPSGAAPRLRVVMVVSNTVDGDSRVVKAARSVAAAGYDTVVVGRAPGQQREEYALGAAQVVRVPVPGAVAAYRKGHPARGPLGWLGYRSAEQVRARRDVQRARRGDLAVADELIRRQAAGAGASARLRLRARRSRLHAADRARGYWIEGRRRLFDRSAARAHNPSGLGRIGLRGTLALRRDGGTWRTHPELADLDAAFGPVLDALAPDLVHAHDVDTLGLAVRAALRARQRGRRVRVVYDAHEYVAGIRRDDPTWSPVMLAQERRHIALVDGVVTVSTELAGLLMARYQLPAPPSVVANAPLAAALETCPPAEAAASGPSGDVTAAPSPFADVRARSGLGENVPLVVYTGGVAPLRGLTTVVDALPLLADLGPADAPGVHFAVVVSGRHRYVRQLEQRAAALGVADRLHVLPYVAPDEVVAYVAGADVGVIPLLHTPAHEIAICTKYYEFMHARLPLVVSDMAAQALLTTRLGIGEVYPSGDAAAFAHAARRVLADPKRYIGAYTDEVLAANSWEAQVPALLDLYGKVLAQPRAAVPGGIA